jgi:hypothetical protein
VTNTYVFLYFSSFGEYPAIIINVFGKPSEPGWPSPNLSGELEAMEGKLGGQRCVKQFKLFYAF